MPIDTARNLVFVHIPKTGGSSIERMFSLNGTRNLFSETPLASLSHLLKTPQHLTWLELKGVLPAEFCARAYKFAFVRNPWDRFVSEYAWRKAWCTREVARRLGCYYGEEHLTDLDAFVTAFSLPREQRLDARRGFDGHLETQRSFLIDEHGALSMDFIGRFETFEQDVRAVAGTMGIPAAGIPREGTSRREQDYRPYYSAYARDAIREIYQEDIETFGYEF